MDEVNYELDAETNYTEIGDHVPAAKRKTTPSRSAFMQTNITCLTRLSLKLCFIYL